MTTPDTAVAVRTLIADDVLPALCDFVRIPALSRFCCPDWESRGELLNVLQDAVRWATRLFPSGHFEISSRKGVTPCLFVDIPGTQNGCATILGYGHLDKQPAGGGWSEGRTPYDPILRDGKLYGRGAADDGYAFYTFLAALAAAHRTGEAPRFTGLFETDEESGSKDFERHLETYAARIGHPSLIIALDLGCETYDELWCTQSLRGIVSVRARVSVLERATHSGSVSGAVPSSMRIWRLLLERLEESSTGRIRISECHGPMPAHLRQPFSDAARRASVRKLPLLDGVSAQHESTARFRAMTWEPALSVLGADGLPPCQGAAAVVRPYTTLALSLRIAPTADAQAALDAVLQALTQEIPYGAKVDIESASSTPGFCAPALSDSLLQSLTRAAWRHFNGSIQNTFEGGSIGVLSLLKRRFPDSTFLLTGLLGPGSHAHGPNESLDLDALERMTCLVTDLFTDLGKQGP